MENNGLEENSVIRKFWITTDDGKSYDAEYYDCRIILAIFFRVNPGFHYANFMV
jgi:hypothetical protein